MRRLRTRRPVRLGDDESVLPLINIVFLLLIFFLLAGRIDTVPKLGIELPEAASGAPETLAGPLVQITAEGALRLDGEPVEEDALIERLSGREATAPKAPVRLRADGAAPAARVIGLAEALRAAGAGGVELMTQPAANR